MTGKSIYGNILMIKSDSSKFDRPLYILYPGDFFASKENCVLGTVTGSCLSVCLYDAARGLGGMGLFVVPGAMGTEGIITDEIARVGVLNMEYLMGEIVKLGGDRRYLKAKIFGAGYIDGGTSTELSQNNIRFIHEYFNFEKISIERSDLGGEFRRRLYFTPKEGSVYRQILKNNEESSEFVALEKEYIDSEFRNTERKGKVLLFE